jgi:hypothetical protein
VLKSLHRLFRCWRLDRIFGSRRLAGLNPVSESLAEHAYRTEFHRSRKLVTATRAGALKLRAHGPNRPSTAICAESNTTLHGVMRKRPARAPGKLSFRSTNNCVFLYTSATNQVSEQDSDRRCPAGRLLLITSFAMGRSKLTAVNRRLSRSP